MVTVIRPPLRARLVTDDERAKLEQRIAQARASYTPTRGFLLDEPLTRLPGTVYRRRPPTGTPA